MRYRRTLLAALVGGLMALGVGVRDVQADSIKLTAFSTTPSAGGTLFNYTVRVTDDARVETGDYFVIFDFSGFTGVTIEPADWSFSLAPHGTAPLYGSAVEETATAPNLQWTYTGTASLGPDAVLGTFSAETSLTGITLGWLGATTTKDNTNSLLDGQKVHNNDRVPVPVPLPLAAWGGLALFGLMAGHSIRKHRLRDA